MHAVGPPRVPGSASFSGQEDTIAAVATPPGQGGVGIVRLSGGQCRRVLARLFVPSNQAFREYRPAVLHHGQLLDARGLILDQALAVLMPGPHSYTGEDVVEFHCHGGPTILAALLEALLDLGAEDPSRSIRLAMPGEFTKRAFCNGRLDLTQAEAVAEAIAAPSRIGLALAQQNLDGAMGRRIRELRTRLESLRALLTLALDFPEEELDDVAREASEQSFGQGLAGVAADIAALLGAGERGRCWREGALVVLAGRVNAGKSSLMNALLGRRRAIVSERPGTTRDYLEEGLNLEGLPVRLIDTAGLRDTGDRIEQEGLAMSRDLARDADLVLLVVDAASGEPLLGSFEVELLSGLDPGRALAVCNKSDLLPELDVHERDDIKAALRRPFVEQGLEALFVSARSGKGLDMLLRRMRERIVGQSQPAADELVPNLRQGKALALALAEAQALMADHAAGLPGDVLSVGLEHACNLLAEITGEITSKEILDSVFARFCIGK